MNARITTTDTRRADLNVRWLVLTIVAAALLAAALIALTGTLS